MPHPTREEFAAQKPIDIQCKCSWEGRTDQLIGRLASNDLYCPSCGRLFKARPTPHPVPAGQ